VPGLIYLHTDPLPGLNAPDEFAKGKFATGKFVKGKFVKGKFDCAKIVGVYGHYYSDSELGQVDTSVNARTR